MLELLKTSIAGANLIPTSLLALLLLYWLAVIVGALDLRSFHIHIDTHAGPHIGGHAGPHVDTHVGVHAGPHAGAHVDTHVDTHVHVGAHAQAHAGPHAGNHSDAHDGGFFYSILLFLKAKDVPFMILLSIIVLVFWSISMFLHLLPIETGGLINALLLIPAFIVSVILCRFILIPLRGLFENNDNKSVEELIVGKVCIASCDVYDGRLGKAELGSGSKSYVINIRTADSSRLNKGEKALVIQQDSEKNFYLVKKFEGVD